MFGRIEKSIDIMAPPEKVWELLALDRWLEWQVSPRTKLPVKGMEFTSEVSVPEEVSSGCNCSTKDGK